MFYAILAYHEEEIVESWTKEEDSALMEELLEVNQRLISDKTMGPCARLGPTREAATLRGKGEGFITDGPFAETKEQLLGFYVVERPSLDAAIDVARQLRRANPTATYEVRPVMLYRQGATLSDGEVQP